MDTFLRERNLIGDEKSDILKNSSVAVFGLGGVGSYVCEALCRGGVGKLLLCDNDVVAEHNINRQLFALHSTIGQLKTQAAFDRLKDINPEIELVLRSEYYSAENENTFDLSSYDYVADCIDSVTSKIRLIVNAKNSGVPIISSMGTGNKLYQNFEISDIYKTEVCPLAKVLRHELKKRNVTNLKVVYTKEPPLKPLFADETKRKQTPASISYVPATAGLLIAGEIIRNILKVGL